MTSNATANANANADKNNADRISKSNKLTEPGVSGGQLIANNPNDEAYVVHDNRNIVTPRSLQPQSIVKSPTDTTARLPFNAAPPMTTSSKNVNNGVPDTSSNQAVRGGVLVNNAPIDERIDVNDADVIPTPRERSVHGEGSEND